MAMFTTVKAAEEFIEGQREIQRQINFGVCHLVRYALEGIRDGDLELAKKKLRGILEALEV